MKLDEFKEIKHIDFDIQNRTITVFHTGRLAEIEKSILDLNLGGNIISSEEVDIQDFDEQDKQRKLLWSVLIINFSFFAFEIVFGLFSKSLGLVADSLDMLADSFVYAISLFAVGGAVLFKKRISKIAGYFQMALALIGFVEVL